MHPANQNRHFYKTLSLFFQNFGNYFQINLSRSIKFLNQPSMLFIII